MKSAMDQFTIHPRANAPRKHVSGHKLRDVYKRPSAAKIKAFEYCVSLCDLFKGRDFAISRYNHYAFTVMFDFDNPETGKAMRAVITRDYNQAYYL